MDLPAIMGVEHLIRVDHSSVPYRKSLTDRQLAHYEFFSGCMRRQQYASCAFIAAAICIASEIVVQCMLSLECRRTEVRLSII